MKIPALLFFLLAGAPAAIADTGVLANSDFSDGIAHWEGNCHTAGGASDDSNATSGIVVNLRGSDWTKVSQNFEAKSGDYVLTVTYTATPGMDFSNRREDYQNTTSKMGLNGLAAVGTRPGDWCLIVVDMGVRRFTYWQITPVLNATGVQTLKAHVTLKSGDDFKKGFDLGFPPGHGTINLQSITLVPFSGSAT